MPEKILLVDEQLYMLRLIEHHLEKAGYELIKARNPEEARAAMETAKPLLVVGDTKGLQVSPSIPAIRLTDEPPNFDKSQGESDGDIVFHKPFSPTQLVAQVKKLMPPAASSTGGVPL